MGVRGEEPVTLGPGQTFYESANDIHTISRNPSKTTPVKVLVFLIKDKDAPIFDSIGVIPVPTSNVSC
jgi:quercetin dioxygenase-like cupin family protein